MHNDLILNWIPVYIKVTKIDSVRFDHTGIKSFFFKFQFSVIFYNFIFSPPFLYFFFFLFLWIFRFIHGDFCETGILPCFSTIYFPQHPKVLTYIETTDSNLSRIAICLDFLCPFFNLNYFYSVYKLQICQNLS